MRKNHQNKLNMLAVGCERVAQNIRQGKINTKNLRRSVVFFDDGKPGCSFGLAIQAAGLQKTMKPFKGPTFDGTRGAKWWSNVKAYEFISGKKADSELESLLEELERCNDYVTGSTKRKAVTKCLQAVAEKIRSVR